MDEETGECEHDAEGEAAGEESGPGGRTEGDHHGQQQQQQQQYQQPPPGPYREPPPHREGQLTLEEKKYLLSVERGDLASVRRYLENARVTGSMDINCVDPLGRSALLMAIDNENLEMVEVLIENKVEMKDALLHAINEEYVEAVELLLEHEETIHTPGEPHSWEAIDRDTATFTPDITPLILAAHRDNYEIIKILLDRGATLPTPHDVRCGCEDCVQSSSVDSLRHSRSRINAYRALASPSLIALSSKDPIMTAFELSWELRRLSLLEHEFKNEYQELRRQCQDFATALLDHTRSSYELEVLLNYDPTGPAFEHGDRMLLCRLKLAIKYKQKKFCAHPNVQQLLASIWYEGLPGFRRKNIALQMLEILRIGALFPVYSIAYILAPHSQIGRTLRKPFIKFICHSASYVTFLFLLILASQRIETVIVEWFGTEEMKERVRSDVTTKRGAPPSIVEWMILAWVIGLIWSEIKQLWELGPSEYISDMWNIIDFITNSLYVATVALRIIAYFQVQKEIALETGTAFLPREKWDAWDPILIAEGVFAAANIFSSLKLVYIFSVNPHLGPLQISLGRMVIDIIKFFFVYSLVLFAFACGMNQLLWYYADMERKICYTTNQHQQHHGSTTAGSNTTTRTADAHRTDPGACLTWRRFANSDTDTGITLLGKSYSSGDFTSLFESSQTLFWASFGLIDLDSFELTGIQSYTRFWGMLMFGSYCVINVVVLLNLLIAMMNHSYQMISEHADVEWKFARSKLWMSYFEDGGTVPPPFNVIPTPKSCYYLLRWIIRNLCGNSKTAKKEQLKTIRKKVKQASERDQKYQTIMRNLVRRYITDQQRKAENQGVTEDDVSEIKQDISSFRYELNEILRNSGFNTSSAKGQAQATGGKKGRQKERRLMKGFNIGLVEGSVSTIPEPSDLSPQGKKSPRTRFARLARLASGAKRAQQKRGRWSHLVEATRSARAAFSRSRSDDSISSQASSDRPSARANSSQSGSTVSVEASIGGASSDDFRTRKTDDRPASVKRSMFARKIGIGTLSFNPSKLRSVFHDTHDKTLGGSVASSPTESATGRSSCHESASIKLKAQRTVSAPSFALHQRAKLQQQHSLEQHPADSPTTTSTDSNWTIGPPVATINVIAPDRSLSPIPSCASSAAQTPRNSITGSADQTAHPRATSPPPPSFEAVTASQPAPPPSYREAISSPTSSLRSRDESMIPLFTLNPSTPHQDSFPSNDGAVGSPDSVGPEKVSCSSSQEPLMAPPSASEATTGKPSNGSLNHMPTIYGVHPLEKQMTFGWI